MDLLEGEYEPGGQGWANDQVRAYEASGGREANTLFGKQEWPIVVVTSRGAESGKLRKNPVMRVERDGVYTAVASNGGAPEHPDWYHNFIANPVVQLQDGPEPALYGPASPPARNEPNGGGAPCTRRTPSTRRRPTGRSRSSCWSRSQTEQEPVRITSPA